MKVLILGSGRMGIRHALGVSDMANIESIIMIDRHENALIEARKRLTNSKFGFELLSNFKPTEKYDVAIIATTANARLEQIEVATQAGCTFFLIEKPLGQSIEEVEKIHHFFKIRPDLIACVNFVSRLSTFFRQLKQDLNDLPQLKGTKTLTINTGSLGIGVNGIHYLDLLYFLFDANRTEIVAAEIEDSLLPSGRGKEFADFGGWALMKIYNNDKYLAKAFLSITNESTVFGGLIITAPHGQVRYEPSILERTDALRKIESTAPVYLSGVDYLPEQKTYYEAVDPGTFTKEWLSAILKGEIILPTVAECLDVHYLLFDWLSKSNSYKDKFPIT